MAPRTTAPRRASKRARSPSVESPDEQPQRKAHRRSKKAKIKKRRQIRHPLEQSPKLGSHILFLFPGPIGPASPSPITLHTALVPPHCLRILESRARSTGFFILTDFEAESVEMWRAFLYEGKVFSQSAEGNESDERTEVVDNEEEAGSEEKGDPEWLRLARAYLLAKEVGDEAFGNAVVDALIEKTDSGDYYPTSLSCEVWPATAHDPRDGLRALLVDFHVWKGLGHGIEPPHDDADGPDEFRDEVLRAWYRAGMRVENPEIVDVWKVDACRYHTHKNTARCAR